MKKYWFTIEFRPYRIPHRFTRNSEETAREALKECREDIGKYLRSLEENWKDAIIIVSDRKNDEIVTSVEEGFTEQWENEIFKTRQAREERIEEAIKSSLDSQFKYWMDKSDIELEDIEKALKKVIEQREK